MISEEAALYSGGDQRNIRIEVVDDASDGDSTPETRLGGCNSIVSIRIKASGANAEWLNMDQLKTVHKWLAADASSLLEGFEQMVPKHVTQSLVQTRCFVGQPVKLGKFAVLRLAMSAPLARRCADSQGWDQIIGEDRLAVRKMLFVADCLGFL